MDKPIDVLIVGGGPGGLFMAARLAATRRADAGLRRARTRWRSRALHRRAFGRQLCEIRSARQRDPQPADVGPLPVAGRDSGRLRDARAAGDGDRSAGLRSRAGGSGGRGRRRDPRWRAGHRARGRPGRRTRHGRRYRCAGTPRGARVRRDLQVPAAVRIRTADHVPADGPARAPGPLPQGRRAALRTGRRARRFCVGGAGAAARRRVRADRRDGVARHPRAAINAWSNASAIGGA